MNNNKPLVIVSELIERFEKAIDEGDVGGYLPGMSFGDLLDFVNFKFYYNLEYKMKSITHTNDETYKRIVLHKAFKMLDNAKLINGDMRTIFNNEFY